MDERYVVGIDASTQSTKAIAWNREGIPVAEGRAPVPLHQPQPGYIEQDPEDWWSATRTALNAVTKAIDPAQIEALAISNQRETVAFIDREGRPLAPGVTWLDSRAIDLFRAFAEAVGPERIHKITGKPVDVIPVVYRLDWYRKNAPDLLDSAHCIVDVHGFLTRRLTGAAHATYTSADPFGLFDIEEKAWSQLLLDRLEIPLVKLPPAHKPGSLIGRVSQDGARETGLREGTPIYAAGGDGQCAGLGVNAARDGVVYLNLGTAIIAGLWSPTPEIGPYWRTMISPTGSGYFLESVQRAGAFFVNWVIDTFMGGRSDPGIFARMEAEATEIPIGSGGLLVCPYLTGCMDPHWDSAARATFTGLGSEHRPAHIYRAALEAITLETARALEAMRGAGLHTNEILAIGGGAGSPLWLQMIANATGLPTRRSLTNEASALGAGIIAAAGAGWYPSIEAAAAGMTRIAETIEPDTSVRATWDALSRRQAAVYAANKAFSSP